MIHNVLFADDDPVTAKLIKTKLEAHGYVVTTAENGIKALEIIERQSVDLVITDVVMPGMDGVDLYQALKKNPKTAGLPVMIVTDQAMFVEAFTELGVKFFIAKSASIANLIAKIKEVERSGQPRGLLYKVIVGAVRPVTIEQMSSILRERNCLVSAAGTTADILARTFLMIPDVIILDVTLHDLGTVTELVRALRCFHFLKKTRLILFTDFSPEESSTFVSAIEDLKVDISAAMEAGVTQYIGRFSRVTFVEQLATFGII